MRRNLSLPKCGTFFAVSCLLGLACSSGSLVIYGILLFEILFVMQVLELLWTCNLPYEFLY